MPNRSGHERDTMIYLDNAATSWPKPECVYQTMDEFLRAKGGNPGRGSHSMALAAGETVEETRLLMACFINASEAQRVIFTLNCTDVLNMGLVGRFYASSKICSECGHVNHSLMLSDRQWACIGCGALHDRDWNAAKNILQEGLRTFGSGYVEGMGRGQLVRPVFQAKLEEASTSTGAHFCALER
ncbi:aminotransferase class V-fold PLP-dependent enzyme [Dehalococcoidia bacterium]|nr:aminotransferase class V-fold PLP-dependent enzyme [Dehalococcoidia bacterium]